MKLRAALFVLVLATAGCEDSVQAPPKVALTVLRAGNGVGTISSSVPGLDCGTDCSEIFDEGTLLTLVATPAPGSTFSGWSGAECSGTGPCVLTVTVATSVTATFTLNRYPLTVTRSGNGNGSIGSSPPGIDCTPDCSENFNHGTTVVLAASPAVGSTFVGWSGGGCSGVGACSVNVTGPISVAATFALAPQTLTVARAGTGTGTITSSPAGLSCGEDCIEDYNFGTRVTLTANPASGSGFAGWSGGGCSGTGTCVVTLTSNTTVTATFNVVQHTLTVTRSGSGSGVVGSIPAGVNCGLDCSESYPHGTVVNLSASPAAGSTFTGWLGGGCSGTGVCVVTLTAATTVAAIFSLPQHTLTVTRGGSGIGTVTSSPAGVSCGTDCSELYNSGTLVTLTAAASSGSTFSGWSGGGCTGVGTCVVTVTAAMTVNASFADVGAPTLVSSTPVDATIGVADNTTIQLTFSEPMNQALTQAAFQLWEPAGVTGTFQWQGNVMTFTPSAPFACTPGGTIVQWFLTTAARDVAGNPLATQVDRSFRVIRCVQDTFVAESARDGYITSAGVVTGNATNIYVGDYPNNAHARGFVSFDFSGLPTDATVTGGSLQMWFTQIGTPSQLGPLLAEPVTYGTLGAGDFAMTASGPSVAGLVMPSTVTWTVDAAMVSAWTNRATLGSRLQMRLRTTYEFYHNAGPDAFDFQSTEGADATRRPTLTVNYRAR